MVLFNVLNLPLDKKGTIWHDESDKVVKKS